MAGTFSFSHVKKFVELNSARGEQSEDFSSNKERQGEKRVRTPQLRASQRRGGAEQKRVQWVEGGESSIEAGRCLPLLPPFPLAKAVRLEQRPGQPGRIDAAPGVY